MPPQSIATFVPGAKGIANDLSGERDAAFAALVSRHASLMYRVAFSLLRNPEDAEDAVQEAFLKLYRSDSWTRMQEEKAFLARTVWRVALDRLPKAKQQEFVESTVDLSSNTTSPETAAVRSAQSTLLRRLIDALPKDLREVLLLSAIEELNSREIAALLELPEGTVRSRLMRARDELKRRFEAQQGGKL